MVPEGWKELPAKDVCKSITVGVVIKPSEYYVAEGEGVRAFRSANVREGFVNDSDWVYFSAEGHEKNKKSELKAGDVLVVRSGYPGTACVVTPEFAGSNAIDIVIARPDTSKVIPEYLCAFTNSEVGRGQILNLQGGMAQKHLNVGAYKTLELTLPPIPEQEKIAKILSTWDEAIATTEQLLANSEQQKKALMQQLLTGKKRLPGFEGEWRKVELGDVLEYRQPTPYLVKSTEYSDEYKTPVLTAGKTFILGYTDEDSGVFEEGLPVIIFDDFTTSSRFVDFEFKVKSSAMKILNARPGYSIKYVFEAMQMVRYAVGGHQRHWISIFANLVVPMPSFEEQEAIASVLSSADEEIKTLRTYANKLVAEKKSLMQQLLTGNCRVKIDRKDV
ncbi:MAG: restriction endonuclease subunit S [Alloalcanivorax sp.]